MTISGTPDLATRVRDALYTLDHDSLEDGEYVPMANVTIDEPLVLDPDSLTTVCLLRKDGENDMVGTALLVPDDWVDWIVQLNTDKWTTVAVLRNEN